MSIFVGVQHLNLQVHFQDGWEQYMQGEEWNRAIEDLPKGLDRKRVFECKGIGKGKSTKIRGTNPQCVSLICAH